MSLEDHLNEMIIQKAGNLKEFSRMVNIPYTTIRSILERGVMNAKTQNILDICKLLEITPEILLEMDNNIVGNIVSATVQLNPTRQTAVYNFATNQLNEQRVEETPAIYHTVEVYSLLSAGTGIVDLDPTDTTEIELNGHVPPHDLAFEVRGDSMEPVFENGEIVFVKKTQDIHNGQIIAVQINEEAFIKKVYINNDHMRLVSLNKEYEDIIANEDDDIRIVGKVLI